MLIRQFDSLESREAQEASFYGSEDWLENFEEPIMKLIHSYLTVVVDASWVDASQVDASTCDGQTFAK